MRSREVGTRERGSGVEELSPGARCESRSGWGTLSTRNSASLSREDGGRVSSSRWGIPRAGGRAGGLRWRSRKDRGSQGGGAGQGTQMGVSWSR